MASELPSDPNPYQIEPDLSAYAPRPPRIDRDRLMFEAGRAAALGQSPAGVGVPLRPGVIAWFPGPPTLVPSSWLWPASTLAMTVVAAGLGIALLLGSTPLERVQVVERVVRIPAPVPQTAPQPTLAATSGGLHQADHDLPRQPFAEEEAPVVTIESLPENHLLRVRHVALTQGVDALTPSASRETRRLSPTPTRGSLMRKLASPPAAAPTPALFRWQSWLGLQTGI